MKDVNFVNMHRYQSIERVVYQNVIDLEPKVVVELGHGTGALTAAIGLALSELDAGGKLYSYDINGTSIYNIGGNNTSALQHIQERNLTDIVEFTEGNVFNTWVKNPFAFDLLLIDIDNTWDTLYSIVIANSFINTQILNGAKVLIEGGDVSNPRINRDNPYKSFNIQYLDGSGRTSISALELVK